MAKSKKTNKSLTDTYNIFDISHRHFKKLIGNQNKYDIIVWNEIDLPVGHTSATSRLAILLGKKTLVK